MSIFAISFRIHEDATYGERYESVEREIKALAVEGKHWSETTSFFLIEYPGSANALVTEIQKMSSLSTHTDLLLVINLSQSEFDVIGNVADRDLNVLMFKR